MRQGSDQMEIKQ